MTKCPVSIMNAVNGRFRAPPAVKSDDSAPFPTPQVIRNRRPRESAEPLPSSGRRRVLPREHRPRCLRVDARNCFRSCLRPISIGAGSIILGQSGQFRGQTGPHGQAPGSPVRKRWENTTGLGIEISRKATEGSDWHFARLRRHNGQANPTPSNQRLRAGMVPPRRIELLFQE